MQLITQTGVISILIKLFKTKLFTSLENFKSHVDLRTHVIVSERKNRIYLKTSNGNVNADPPHKLDNYFHEKKNTFDNLDLENPQSFRSAKKTTSRKTKSVFCVFVVLNIRAGCFQNDVFR